METKQINNLKMIPTPPLRTPLFPFLYKPLLFCASAYYQRHFSLGRYRQAIDLDNGFLTKLFHTALRSILQLADVAALHVRIESLLFKAHHLGDKLYLIIDEYDNFTYVFLNEQGNDIESLE